MEAVSSLSTVELPPVVMSVQDLLNMINQTVAMPVVDTVETL